MSNDMKRLLMTVPALAGLLVLSGCGNVLQPKTGCTIGQGDFAARYTPKAGEAPTGACADLKGEIINLRDYTNPDEQKNYIAIRPAGLNPGSRVDPNPEDKPYSFGEYPKESNAESFCVSPTMTSGRTQLSSSGSGGAVDRTYEWSNVQILVTSRAAGTQLKANLKYTDAISGCTANYDVVAMWPAISCGTKNAQGVTVADDTKCATKAVPEQNIKIGCNASGFCLSPDIKTKCDPDILLCVLDGTPPVFSDGT